MKPFVLSLLVAGLVGLAALPAGATCMGEEHGQTTAENPPPPPTPST